MSVVATQHLCGLLREYTAKWLARITRRHPETAARWRRGQTEPTATELVILMAAKRAIAARINRLAGYVEAAAAIDRARLVAETEQLELALAEHKRGRR